MAIPGFFGQWLSKYKYLIKRYSREHNPIPKNVSGVYLDMNAILHTIASYIWGYNENGPTSRLSNRPDSYLMMHFEAFLGRYLSYVLEHLKPKDYFYIAVDGVPPVAKMQQQRSRRFAAYLSRISDPLSFDTNKISPGTEFMDFVDASINNWLQENKHKIPKNTYFSGHRVPGEGEQKIVRFLRAEENLRGEHIIHGPDADLILLGCILKVQRPQISVSIYRENFDKYLFDNLDQKENSTGNFDFIRCSEVIAQLYEIMKPEIQEEKQEEKQEENKDIFNMQISIAKPESSEENKESYQALVDFLVIMCFVGNDWIPTNPVLLQIPTESKTEAETKPVGAAVDFLLKIYNSEVYGRKNLFVDDEVDYPNLTDFFVILDAYQEQYTKWIPDYFEDTFSVDVDDYKIIWAKHEFNYSPEFQELQIATLDEENEPDEYYKQVFGAPWPNLLKNWAIEYLNGFAWTLRYYLTGDVNTEWYFPNFTAPMPSLVLSVIDEFIPRAHEPFPNSRVYNILQQELAILPISTLRILQIDSYRKDQIIGIDSPLLYLWPSIFEMISLPGQKHKIPRIPKANMLLVYSFVEALTKSKNSSIMKIIEPGKIKFYEGRSKKIEEKQFSKEKRESTYQGKESYQGKKEYQGRGRGSFQGRGRGSYQRRGRGRGSFRRNELIREPLAAPFTGTVGAPTEKIPRGVQIFRGISRGKSGISVTSEERDAASS